jgi:hypothetical protein
MSNSYSANVGLATPAYDDTGWNDTLDANRAVLDGLAAIGGLAVRPHVPAAPDLRIDVAAGVFRDSRGSWVSYAGTGGTPITLTGSATNSIYMTDAGVPTVSTSGFPAGANIVPLAVVTCGVAAITPPIVDARRPLSSGGAQPRGAVASKTAAYAATPADRFLACDSTGGAFSVTLPSAALYPGLALTVKRVNAGANDVTLAGAGGQTIDGAATLALTAQWAYATVFSDGVNWLVGANG